MKNTNITVKVLQQLKDKADALKERIENLDSPSDNSYEDFNELVDELDDLAYDQEDDVREAFDDIVEEWNCNINSTFIQEDELQSTIENVLKQSSVQAVKDFLDGYRSDKYIHMLDGYNNLDDNAVNDTIESYIDDFNIDLKKLINLF